MSEVLKRLGLTREKVRNALGLPNLANDFFKGKESKTRSEQRDARLKKVERMIACCNGVEKTSRQLAEESGIYRTTILKLAIEFEIPVYRICVDNPCKAKTKIFLSDGEKFLTKEGA